MSVKCIVLITIHKCMKVYFISFLLSAFLRQVYPEVLLYRTFWCR